MFQSVDCFDQCFMNKPNWIELNWIEVIESFIYNKSIFDTKVWFFNNYICTNALDDMNCFILSLHKIESRRPGQNANGSVHEHNLRSANFVIYDNFKHIFWAH